MYLRWEAPCRLLPGSAEHGLVLFASVISNSTSCFQLRTLFSPLAEMWELGDGGTADTRKNAPPVPPERLKAGEQVGKSSRSPWSRELWRSRNVVYCLWYCMCWDQVPGVRCSRVRSLDPHCMMAGERSRLGLNKSFREILPYYTSFPRLQKWESSRFYYEPGLVGSERSYWEKCFVDAGKWKIIK